MKLRVVLAFAASLFAAVSSMASPAQERPFQPKPVPTWCAENRATFIDAMSAEGYRPVLLLGGSEPFTSAGKPRIAVVFLHPQQGTWVLAVADAGDPGVCVIASGKDLEVVQPQQSTVPNAVPHKGRPDVPVMF